MRHCDTVVRASSANEDKNVFFFSRKQYMLVLKKHNIGYIQNIGLLKFKIL